MNSSTGQYNTIREREINTESGGHSSTTAVSHVHEQYDEVATFRDRQDGKECHSKQESKKATLPDYEIVCVIPTEDQGSKEISSDHQLFGDEMYSTNQPTSTKMEQKVQMDSEELYSEIADNNSPSSSLNAISKNEPEYAQPQVAKRVQSNTKGQGTLLVEGNFYHSLEGSDKQLDSTSVSGTPKGQQTKHTENTVHIYDSPDSVVSPSNISTGKNKCSTTTTQMDTGGNRYHTLTPPTTMVPQVAKRAQSNNKGQGTLIVEGNFYHSLEGSDKQLDSTSVSGTPKGQQTKHTENTVHIYDSPDSVASPSNISTGKNKCRTITTEMDTGENRYHTLTSPTTTVPQCNQSLNEDCPANFPAILLNNEHCQFNDPLYEGAPQHSSTLQECNDVKVGIYNFDDSTYA